MDTVKVSLDALERAKRRRKELKRLIKNLIEQYRLLKKEEDMHTKRARALIQEHEYSGSTDTIKLDEPTK